MSETDQVLERLYKLLNVKNDSQLAKELGIATSTLSNWRTRDTVPYKSCVDVAQQKGISLDWLLMGKEDAKPTLIEASRLFMEQLQDELGQIKARLDKLEQG